MKIHVRSKHFAVDEALRCHIERRLEFSLGRCSPRILRTTVQLLDLNGPRGGEDKACRIEVRLRPTGTLFVEDRDADLFAAVDRAADRTGRSVARALKRERELERRPPPANGASAAPARIVVEEELETKDGETELEIELKWPVAPVKLPARRAHGAARRRGTRSKS